MYIRLVFRCLSCAALAVWLTLFAGCTDSSDFGGLDGGDGVGADGSEPIDVEVDGFDGSAQSLKQHSDNLTSDEAYHLLRRAAFGASPDDVDAVVANGLIATVNDLLTIKYVPDDIRALADTKEHRADQRWLIYMIEGPNPLLERMTLFWHDRFATSRRVVDGKDKNLGVLHLNMLRDNALGNYRTFLQQLTIDPLMLIWLNGANSPKDNPNENYAREFWELFTLGRDVLYNEEDIRESTRAFTGITLLDEPDKDKRPIYDILNHDNGMKTIMDLPAYNHDYFSIIDLTLDLPEAARYVGTNLFKAFVHSNPSEATITELAQYFIENNYEIKPLIRKILISEAMFSPEAFGTLISSPVEHYIGFARTLDLHMVTEDAQTNQLNNLAKDLAAAGQELLNPPDVDGWYEEQWLQDQWLINRVSAFGRKMQFGSDGTEELPYHLLPPVGQWDQREVRKQIVDAMAKVFHLQLSDEEREIYVEVLDQDGWRAFHHEEPENQPRHVALMIALMAMHPGVIAR